MSESSKIAAPEFPRGCASPRDAFIAGFRDAFGSPAFVLGASYVGFGSLVRELDFNLFLGLASSVFIWALPAQVTTVELYTIGAPLLSIFIAVALINFRFMPMVVSVMPLLRPADGRLGRLYLTAHMVAVTAWALTMLRGPEMPRDQRLPYLLGCSFTLLGAALAGTAVGYFASGAVPPAVSYAFVFTNPRFFLLIMLVDLRQRPRVLAILFGAVAGPLLHLVTPTWGLLIAGLIAGSIAFFADRHWPSRVRR
jgi:predicted branched-subunit amino acid permease